MCLTRKVLSVIMTKEGITDTTIKQIRDKTMKTNTWYKIGQLEDLEKFTDLSLFSLNKQCEDKGKYDLSDRHFGISRFGMKYDKSPSEGIWVNYINGHGYNVQYVKFNEYYGFLESHYVMAYKEALGMAVQLIS